MKNERSYRSKSKSMGWTALIIFLVGCNLVRQNVQVTRVEETQVEVTRVIEVIQEVTRLVEVPVEVTRIVQENVPVTVEVTVEVTRIVEEDADRKPTPQPTDTAPTTEAAATSTQQAIAPPIQPVGPSSSEVAVQMDGLLRSMGGMIDAALRSGTLLCDEWVASWDVFMKLPAASAETQIARALLLEFGEMTDNCRSFLEIGGGTMIPFQQWGTIRQAINEALEAIRPLVEG